MMNPSVHPQHEVVIDASAIGHRRSSSLASATASKPESHMTTLHRTPIAQGLYNPSNEHDACGVGFVVNIKGKKSNTIIQQGLKILENLDHRGAVGADKLMGDGAGILIQLPDQLYREEMAKQGVKLPPEGEYGVIMVFMSY